MTRKLSVLVIFLALIGSTKGQENDFRTWLTLQAGHEFFKLIDVSFTPEIRLWDNSTRLEGFLAEADASIPLVKIIRFGLNYRYQVDFDNPESFSKTNRYGLYGQTAWKFSNFKVSYRAFYHMEYTDLKTSENGNIPFQQHRHKLAVKYAKKSWDISPSVSAEMFYSISPPSVVFQEKLRLSVGIDYDVSKMMEVGIGYKFQKELYENNPLSSHVLFIGLKFKL